MSGAPRTLPNDGRAGERYRTPDRRSRRRAGLRCGDVERADHAVLLVARQVADVLVVAGLSKRDGGDARREGRDCYLGRNRAVKWLGARAVPLVHGVGADDPLVLDGIAVADRDRDRLADA